jgi:hypothetical protein
MPKRPPKPPSAVYQLKVFLFDIKPQIWRRLEVPADIRMDSLHRVLQASFRWEDCHLHDFDFGGRIIGMLSPDGDAPDTEDERKFRLSQLVTKEGQRFVYHYDFGDDWVHG